MCREVSALVCEVLVLCEVDSAFSAGACLRALLGPDRVRPGRPATRPKASLVAAPVRSAAPVRRHQSLMSDLDRPDPAVILCVVRSFCQENDRDFGVRRNPVDRVGDVAHQSSKITPAGVGW